MTAILSIKPEYAEAIFKGTKQYEFRKVIFKKHVDKVKLYVSKPVGKIVGEFDVDGILEHSPEELWDKTSQYAGIDKESYLEYFKGKNLAFAIKIKNAVKYKEAICPYTQYHNFTPPQSFMYE